MAKQGAQHPCSGREQLLGLPLDGLTMAEAVHWCATELARQQQPDCQRVTAQIVTLNPEIAWAAEQDPRMRTAITEASLVVPDGMGVVLAARLKGQAVPQRVAGFDLMQHLLALAADRGYRVFFLGALPGVAQKAAAAASSQHPGLQVVGTADGYFTTADESACLQRIAELQIDLLFCALGPPRPAETWIHDHRQELAVGLAMGVGGSFNIMAGESSRAPYWMQRFGLEWFYRLLKDPKRWRRLMVIPRYLWLVLWS